MIARAWIALASVILALPAEAASRDCVPVKQLLSTHAFQRYPAGSAHGPWRMPNVQQGTAHLFRTSIRADARGAPDFAGRYKVIQLGCGAGTVCPAFVDRVSGNVVFVPEFRNVSWVLSDFAGAKEVERLTYRRDSRLLVIFGSRNEDERTAGLSLYDWRAGRPHLVRFVPATKLCRENAK